MTKRYDFTTQNLIKKLNNKTNRRIFIALTITFIIIITYLANTRGFLQ